MASALAPTTEPAAGQNLPACPYCSNFSYAILFENVRDRLRHVPGRWAYWRCRACGSAVLCPYPRASELSAFYPPVYTFQPDAGQRGMLKRILARLQYLFFFRPQYAAQVRQVLRGIGWRGQPDQQLLDVGCGRGLRLLAFQKRGFRVQGMDFQPEVVEYLRQELGIPALCTDVGGLSDAYPLRAFDLVTAFHVVEHVPDVDLMLRNCFGLLKPGGWFAAAVPLIDSVQARVLRSRWVAVTEAPRHLTLPTAAGLRIACRRVGFDRVEFRPDATLNCAGALVLSLLPGVATTHLVGGGRWRAVLTGALAALLTVLSLPVCLVENYLVRRPALGMVFARKPG
jgi:SAM-dependent methyltransferase